MTVVIFIVMLLISIQITNKQNNTKASNEILEFERSDSLIILFCLILSWVTDRVIKQWFENQRIPIVIAMSSLLLMALVVVNYNRDKSIKMKHDNVKLVYQALSDIYGKMEPENIDYNQLPFKLEYNEKKKINKIIIDTSTGKINQNTITLAQYAINKFFEELQWTSQWNMQQMELIFMGLPKPPLIAKYPGSDYRPDGWIPLGLNGQGEVGWNLAGPKDLGHSSFVNEEGKLVDTVTTPSAPQALALGSTGGGKSIWCEQMVDVLCKNEL